MRKGELFCRFPQFHFSRPRSARLRDRRRFVFVSGFLPLERDRFPEQVYLRLRGEYSGSRSSPWHFERPRLPCVERTSPLAFLSSSFSCLSCRAWPVRQLSLRSGVRTLCQVFAPAIYPSIVVPCRSLNCSFLPSFAAFPVASLCSQLPSPLAPSSPSLFLLFFLHLLLPSALSFARLPRELPFGGLSETRNLRAPLEPTTSNFALCSQRWQRLQPFSSASSASDWRIPLSQPREMLLAFSLRVKATLRFSLSAHLSVRL